MPATSVRTVADADYCSWVVLLVNIVWYAGIAFGLGYWRGYRRGEKAN